MQAAGFGLRAAGAALGPLPGPRLTLKNDTDSCNSCAWLLIEPAVAASYSEAEAFCWVGAPIDADLRTLIRANVK